MPGSAALAVGPATLARTLLWVLKIRAGSGEVCIATPRALSPHAVPRGRNECYRIHFEVNYVGKMIKAAKRKVTWKFVFAGDKGKPGSDRDGFGLLPDGRP